MFAIVDCNNFYASCERLFQPSLAHTPILVLSNNDGCVIARSNEAKALGIQMGEPFFKIKQRMRIEGIKVFSSNYAFYGDLSQRVMSVIQRNWPEVEIYSIDEAFLDLSLLPRSERELFCEGLQKQVKKETGIPVSIGIGQTKTLAKLANMIAKKKLKIPVFNIADKSYWLKHLMVDEIWGVGGRYTKKLNAMGIMSVEALKDCDERLMKRRFNVMLERTILELRGISCLGLEESKPKKSIVCSRSFGTPQKELGDIKQALASFAARASEKLRAQHCKAKVINVFLHTNGHRADLPQYANHLTQRLIYPSNDTRVITHQALTALSLIFKSGYSYKKTGIMLDEITPNTLLQQDLFLEEESSDSTMLMTVLDAINQRYGQHTLTLASQGTHAKWHMRQALKSPSYTTSWSELPKVNLG
jgi:DNA polymerase V